MQNKKIVIVLPKNNPLSSVNTKPVVMAALPYIINSSLKDLLIIISPYTEDKLNLDIKTIFISKENSLKNKSYYQEVLKIIKYEQPTAIECHQDPKLLAFLANNNIKSMFCLIKHGDYFINKIKEKLFFYRWYYFYKYLKHINLVYCISDYVKATLVKNFPFFVNKAVVLYNSYGHIEKYINITDIQKENIILFAGKPVENKGIVALIKSIPKILKTHSDYKFIIVAGKFSNKDKYYKTFNVLLSNPIIQNLITNNKLIIYKALPIEQVFKLMQKAKISIVPSVFNEPFGLVALESVMAKCLLISSGTGGLKEITGSNALYLKLVNSNEIISSVEKSIEILNNNSIIVDNAYNYAFKTFNAKNLVKIIDNHRLNLLK